MPVVVGMVEIGGVRPMMTGGTCVEVPVKIGGLPPPGSYGVRGPVPPSPALVPGGGTGLGPGGCLVPGMFGGIGPGLVVTTGGVGVCFVGLPGRLPGSIGPVVGIPVV